MLEEEEGDLIDFAEQLFQGKIVKDTTYDTSTNEDDYTMTNNEGPHTTPHHQPINHIMDSDDDEDTVDAEIYFENSEPCEHITQKDPNISVEEYSSSLKGESALPDSQQPPAGGGSESVPGQGSMEADFKTEEVPPLDKKTTPKSRTLPLWMTDPILLQKKEESDLKQRQQLKSQLKLNSENETTAPKYPYIDVLHLHEVLHGRAVCFDLETTGFSRDDCIIEIGGVELIDGYRTGVLFQSYALPRKQIHPKATEVHGLTNQKLELAPPIQHVMASFMEWVGKSPLVAHNSRFDMRMLLQELDQLNLSYLVDGKKVFCTMQYYRKQFPSHSYGLNDLASHYNLSLDYRIPHSALCDAEILAKAFISMKNECKL